MAAVHCCLSAQPEPGCVGRHQHVEGKPGAGVCWGGGVSHLLQRHQRSQWAAATHLVQAVQCQVPPRMPVQVVQVKWQEHVPPLLSAVLSWALCMCSLGSGYPVGLMAG